MSCRETEAVIFIKSLCIAILIHTHTQYPHGGKAY